MAPDRARDDARRTPPGPRGVPLLGLLPALRRDPIGVFMDAAKHFGDVAYLKIGSENGLLLTRPEHIRHVLQDNARNYRKSRMYDRLKVSLGEGLLTSEGAYWLRQRRMAQPAFHRERIAGLAVVMAHAAREVAARWETAAAGSEPLDIADEMMGLTQTIVLRTLLGADLGSFAGELDRAWATINQHIGEGFWSLGLAERLPTPKNRRFHEAVDVLDGAVFHIIEQRRRVGGEGNDLLSMLLLARDEETGETMTDRQLRDEVTTILLAGHETTSLALTWTFYLLSRHHHVRQRLESEIDAELAGRPPRYADLAHLPYARMVIEEAMRLYPPAWGLSRQALAPDEIGGYQVPRGWLVFVVPFVMHRHPAYWDEPDAFDPERFTPERTAARPKFVYLPFGGGPRQCIGNQFAMIEAHLVLATLVQRYRLELVGGPVEPWPLITLRPRHAMRMQIQRRAPGAA
jgi:cytochrome P450